MPFIEQIILVKNHANDLKFSDMKKVLKNVIYDRARMITNDADV